MRATTARTRSFSEHEFNAYSASQVIAEVTESGRTGTYDEVAFLDSNFPVDVGRAVEDIAKGFLDSNIRFSSNLQASTDLLCRMSDDDVLPAGAVRSVYLAVRFRNRVGLGEGSFTLMNKKHRRIEDMFETARKSEKASIRVTFNLILGYPRVETEANRPGNVSRDDGHLPAVLGTYVRLFTRCFHSLVRSFPFGLSSGR